MMRLPTHLDSLAKRRGDFMSAFDGSVVLYSGSTKARNYAANHFPFRASSHFLHFVGWNVPDAYLLMRDGASTLILPTLPEDDVLWHGPSPSDAELQRALGLPITRQDIGTVLHSHGASFQSVALPDASDRIVQERLENVSLDDRELLNAVIDSRLVNDDYALSELKAASQVTREGHIDAMRCARAGLHESHIRAALEQRFTAANMAPAYGSIVTTHGDILHAKHCMHTLADGDLMLIDAGAESEGGYATDVTRTWPVSGTFTTEQKAIYEVVLRSQLASISMLEPGVRYKDVHSRAIHAIADGLCDLGLLRVPAEEAVACNAAAAFFPHGVGHILGLDVHDMEDLGDLAGYAAGRTRDDRFGFQYLRLDRDLSAGAVVTIEPGVYFSEAIYAQCRQHPAVANAIDDDKWQHFAKHVRGIRIEDDILITENGFDVLSSGVPKTVEQVESACTERETLVPN